MYGPDTEYSQLATVFVNDDIITLPEKVPYEEAPFRRTRAVIQTVHNDPGKLDHVHRTIVSLFEGENLQTNLVQLWKEIKKQYNALLQKLMTQVASHQLVIEMYMFSERGHESYKREVSDGRFSRVLLLLFKEMSDIDSSEMSFDVRTEKDERFNEPLEMSFDVRRDEKLTESLQSPTSSMKSFGGESFSIALGGYSGDPYGMYQELSVCHTDTLGESSTPIPPARSVYTQDTTLYSQESQRQAITTSSVQTASLGEGITVPSKQLNQIRHQLEASLNRRLSDVKNRQEKDKMEIIRRMSNLEKLITQDQETTQLMHVKQKQVLDQGLEETRFSLKGLSEKVEDIEQMLVERLQGTSQLDREKIHDLSQEIKDFRTDFCKFQDETTEKIDSVERTLIEVKDLVERSRAEMKEVLFHLTQSQSAFPSQSDSGVHLQSTHHSTQDQQSVRPRTLPFLHYHSSGNLEERVLHSDGQSSHSSGRTSRLSQRDDHVNNLNSRPTIKLSGVKQATSKQEIRSRPQTPPFESFDHEDLSPYQSPLESPSLPPELDRAIKQSGVLFGHESDVNSWNQRVRQRAHGYHDTRLRGDLHETGLKGASGFREDLHQPFLSSAEFREDTQTKVHGTVGSRERFHESEVHGATGYSEVQGSGRTLPLHLSPAESESSQPVHKSSTMLTEENTREYTRNTPVSDMEGTSEDTIITEVQTSLQVDEDLVVEANVLRKSCYLPLTRDILHILVKALKYIKQTSTEISEGGIDTIICLDISASTEGKAFDQMVSVVTDFLNEAEELSNNRSLLENIGIVVVSGSQTEILSPLITQYSDLVSQVCNLRPGGTSPLHTALVLCGLALKDKGGPMSIGGYIVPPRIVVFSDGRPTDDAQMNNPFTESGTKPSEIGERVKKMASQLHHHGYTIFSVPVGTQINRMFLQDIATMGGGKLVNLEDFRFLKKYFHYQVVAGHVIQKCHDTGNKTYSEYIQREVNQPDSGLDQDDIIQITDIIQTSKELEDEEHDNLPSLGSRVQILSGEATSDPPQYGTVVQNLSDGWIKVQMDEGLIHFYNYGNDDHEDVQLVNRPRQLRQDQLIDIGVLVSEKGKSDKKGVVFRVTNSGYVNVRWEDGSMSRCKYGAEGEFDLDIQENSQYSDVVWQWQEFSTQQWINFDSAIHQKIEMAFLKKEKTCVVDMGRDRARIIFDRGHMKFLEKDIVLSIRRFGGI